MPWTGLSLFYQSNLLFKFTKASPELYSISTVSFFLNLITVLTLLFWLIYEVFKRYTNRVVFKKENEGLWRIIEYPIVMTLNIFFIAIPTFVIAAFGTLVKREYRVAEKKLNN